MDRHFRIAPPNGEADSSFYGYLFSLHVLSHLVFPKLPCLALFESLIDEGDMAASLIEWNNDYLNL